MGKKINIHLLPDNKFYGLMMRMIKDAGLVGENQFLVFSTDPNPNFKFIGDYPNIRIISPRISSDEINALFENCKKLVIHNLSFDVINVLSRFQKPEGLTIIWRNWTSDLYSFLQFKKKYCPFDAQTYDIILSKHRFSFLSKPILKCLMRFRRRLKYRKISRVLDKIDYVGNWNEFEIDILKTEYPSFRAKYFYARYDKNPVINNQMVPLNNPEKSIMVGHSGHNVGNHLDAFHCIKKTMTDCSPFKVICPLSYGNINYIEMLSKEGSRFFGDNFIGMRDFLPRDDYFSFLMRIDIFIFYHLMPIAAGSIHQLLKLGKKIFLREENPHYSYLLDLGIKLFSVESIEGMSEDEIFEPIAVSDAEKNAQILNGRISEEQFILGMEMMTS